MRTIILRDPVAIRSLGEAWRRGLPPTPFHGMGFLEAWLAGLPAGSSPFVVLVSEQQQPAALALWCIERSPLGVRVLTGLAGDDAWYHDPWLIEPRREEAVAVALVEALKGAHRDWDLVQLVLRDAVSTTLIRHLARAGLASGDRVDWRQQQTAVLGDDWGRYWGDRPKQLRELVRRRGKKLAALPHRFVEANDARVEGMLETLFALHRERWIQERDWSGYYHLIRGIAQEALAQDRLCLFALEVEGRPIALELLVRCGDRAFELMRIVDPSPDFASLSSGSLLTAWAFERMHAKGVRVVDMGPGHHEWKAGLETERTATVLRVVARPGHVLALLAVGWTGLLKPQLRAAPQLIRLKAMLRGSRRALRPLPSPP